jgi:hypothetical protein
MPAAQPQNTAEEPKGERQRVGRDGDSTRPLGWAGWEHREDDLTAWRPPKATLFSRRS